MVKLFADFETRSHCHLPTKGAYNYAQDPTTEIICCAFYFSDCEKEDAFLFTPGDELPNEYLEWFEAGEPVYFRNAQFDRNIWQYVAVNDHGWPDLPLEQFRCTAYIAQCNNMPASLDNCSRALNTYHKKNPKGSQLISALSIPPYSEDPKLLQEMYDYCIEDVLADAACCAWLREPTDQEWAEYFANERINMRGVKIDREMATAAINYAKDEEDELISVIQKTTQGEVEKARGEKLKKWVMERLTEDQLDLMVKYKGGEKKYSLDREIRARLLLDELPPDVLTVLEASDMAQKSSVSKFKNMVLLADDEDDRVRGAIVANGAAASGRYSSRGLQLHNFPRDAMEDPEAVRQLMLDNTPAEQLREEFDLPIMTILSRMLRSAIIPAQGKVFVPSDWSAIEGRVAPWLCNTRAGDAKLGLFRKGVDTYIHAAQIIYGKDDISKDERQAGKVSELACQFGGGAFAIMGFARGYGIVFDESEALHIRDGWRAANPWAKPMWKAIETAAKGAIKAPGEVFNVGRLQYFAAEGVLNKPMTLFCKLPCGRLLTYPDVVSKVVEGKYGAQVQLSALRAAWTPKVGETQWPRGKLYGGLMFENAVQGTAASLLRHCIADDDTDVVFHVHDELVLEVPDPEADDIADDLEDFMNRPPSWAQGLPLATEALILDRYGK